MVTREIQTGGLIRSTSLLQLQPVTVIKLNSGRERPVAQALLAVPGLYLATIGQSSPRPSGIQEEHWHTWEGAIRSVCFYFPSLFTMML